MPDSMDANIPSGDHQTQDCLGQPDPALAALTNLLFSGRGKKKKLQSCRAAHNSPACLPACLCVLDSNYLQADIHTYI